ncbi:MAG: polysaccharide pyruvyl transferase family protein [Rikenellaceae bacterium]
MARRIAILTQPLGLNYGGVLQAYALAKRVSDRGFDVSVDLHRERYNRLTTLPKIIKHHLLKSKHPSEYSDTWSHIPTQLEFFKKQSCNIDIFISKHMRAIELFDRRGRMRDEFDGYIVGSDQVWRPRYSDNIYNYFLKQVRSESQKKIAYAASFGIDSDSEFTPKQRRECSKLLKRFNAVSLREHSACNIAKRLFSIDAERVADPVLLLDRSDYEALCSNNLHDQRHLLCYLLDPTDNKKTLCGELSGELSLRIEPYYQGRQYPHRRISEAKIPSVEEWLAAIRDSDFIVTDSYHGTLMAIIFAKNFITISNKDRGATRFESILGDLSLMDRLIDSSEMSNREKVDQIISKKIDFIAVKKRLDALRKFSEAFLDAALE